MYSSFKKSSRPGRYFLRRRGTISKIQLRNHFYYHSGTAVGHSISRLQDFGHIFLYWIPIRTIRHMLIKFLWISVEKANARLEYVNTVNPQQLHGHRPHQHCQQKLISNELLIVFKCLAMFYTFTTNKYLQQSCCTWGCVTIASPLARLTCTSSGLSVHMELSGGWVSLLLSSVHLIA